VSSYDALGGDAAMGDLVDDLSQRLVADPLLGPLFDGVDAQALQRHRITYLASVLGGPEQYTGQSMREAHRPLHLTDEHMNRFLRLAEQSLAASDVDPEAAQAVLRLLEPLRPAIIAPGAAPSDEGPSRLASET